MTYLVSDEWREVVERELVPWCLEQAELGDHLLEIGPGPGLTTDALRRAVPHVTAVEVDPSLAAALAARLSGTNVRVVHADATDTGLPAAMFSSAACFTMLHHVPTSEQQDQLFGEVCRVLRDGGVFIGIDSLDSERIRRGHVDDVFNPVDPDTLGDRLRAAGFAEVAIERREDRVRFRATRSGARAT